MEAYRVQTGDHDDDSPERTSHEFRTTTARRSKRQQTHKRTLRVLAMSILVGVVTMSVEKFGSVTTPWIEERGFPGNDLAAVCCFTAKWRDARFYGWTISALTG